MLCSKQHIYARTAEENVLMAIFGQDRYLPIEMELVVNTPGFQKYQCPNCYHVETVMFPDSYAGSTHF